ncbi:hypothetical protein Y032_0011g1393 [Ancylostoma ceylanicum]|uniref:Uncharacterized protein n=1 Tax=Ancylostoma ceylanicum TaxID=53326 RepID=A0A016VEF1_9BILA|nr:hypothetical protein Y032_0011g1393 [Ancylostoma ceylanicum]
MPHASRHHWTVLERPVSISWLRQRTLALTYTACSTRCVRSVHYTDHGYSSSGYSNLQYNPSSSYYSSTPSSSQQYYNPSSNSNAPTRNYNPVINTNLGYAGQVQREQTQQYGYGNMQQPQYGNPNIQYGYYGANERYYDQQQQQYGNQNYGNRQYDSSNYQSWCCGPTSTSCCYQNSNSNSMQYYDPSMNSNQKYTTGYNSQYGYGSSSTISPYVSTTSRSNGKK